MKNLPIVLAILALAVSVYCLYEMDRMQQVNTGVVATEIDDTHDDEEHEHDFEIADVMTKVQRHFNKLYFAGSNENWELAEFYIEETEEAMESLADADVMEDGVNISALVMTKGFQPLEQVELAVKAGDKEQFLAAYTLQLEQCNSCHALTKHSFIKIKAPEKPAYDNQIYTP